MISVLTQVFPFMQMMLNVIGVDQAILQSGLNTIVDWSELWGTSYNASKRKHLSLTKKQKPLETIYFLAGNVLSKSACETDLGVSIS